MKSYQSIRHWLLNLLALNSVFRQSLLLMKYALHLFAGLFLTGCHTFNLEEASVQSVANTNSKPLFDGTTFNGWEGNMEFFRIKDEAIVAGRLTDKIPNNEFLCTTSEYENFDLQLKFKVVGSPQANAGVQFRTKRIPNHHEVIGFQADIGQKYWGALYDESRRRKILAAPPAEDIPKIANIDGWNSYRIFAKGNHIQLFLNGHKTVDYIEKDPNIEKKGVIALQVHSGPACEIHYKDIQIIEYP